MLSAAIWFSGVNCAGLIEARRLRILRSTRRMFSGVNCAGLIEAQKHRFGLFDRQMFSGVNCAGLIEAGISASPCRSIGNGFPALIAPASLKRPSTPILRMPMVSFPALIAPASLKHEETTYSGVIKV